MKFNLTLGTVPTAAIREAFDYMHGCFTDLNHHRVVNTWLRKTNPNLIVKTEISGPNEYRLHYREKGDDPKRVTYFWPEDASEDRWLNCV